MAIQSASGNRESASTLKKMIIECDKLLELYLDVAKKIKDEKDSFWNGEALGVVAHHEQIYSDGTSDFWVDAIKYDRDTIGTKLGGIDTFISKINLVIGVLENLITYSDKLNNLADEIEKYQKKINKVLESKSIKSKAVESMVAAGFASNKDDAEKNKYIPKEKVLTDPDNWEGDLKFERQNNGTYLVIKVGKDGSEVPMGYTTKKGKDEYYKEAKKKVLKELEKGNQTSTNTSTEKETDSQKSNAEIENDNVGGLDESKIKKKLKRSDYSFKADNSDLDKVSKEIKKEMIDLGLTEDDIDNYEFTYSRGTDKNGKYIEIKPSISGTIKDVQYQNVPENVSQKIQKVIKKYYL